MCPRGMEVLVHHLNVIPISQKLQQEGRKEQFVAQDDIVEKRIAIHEALHAR